MFDKFLGYQIDKFYKILWDSFRIIIPYLAVINSEFLSI